MLIISIWRLQSNQLALSYRVICWGSHFISQWFNLSILTFLLILIWMILLTHHYYFWGRILNFYKHVFPNLNPNWINYSFQLTSTPIFWSFYFSYILNSNRFYRRRSWILYFSIDYFDFIMRVPIMHANDSFYRNLWLFWMWENWVAIIFILGLMQYPCY